MDEILEAIENVINFIQILWTFITNAIESLILALGYFISLIPKVTTLIATLPSWLLAFAEITLGVSIAYFIIGRTGGKSG